MLKLFQASEYLDEVLQAEVHPAAERLPSSGDVSQVVRCLFVPTYEVKDAEDRMQELIERTSLEAKGQSLLFTALSTPVRILRMWASGFGFRAIQNKPGSGHSWCRLRPLV